MKALLDCIDEREREEEEEEANKRAAPHSYAKFSPDQLARMRNMFGHFRLGY